MYYAKKKTVSVTGKASLGWFLGRGYVQEVMTVKVERWCVFGENDTKPTCICNGKKQAEIVAKKMNGEVL